MLVQKGTPLYTVATLMGHSTLEMTQRYAHLAPDTTKVAALSHFRCIYGIYWSRLTCISYFYRYFLVPGGISAVPFVSPPIPRNTP